MTTASKHSEQAMTAIEWTHAPGFTGVTWNPIRARNKATGGVGHYCARVSDGCRNCYAERLQTRFRNPIRYAAQDRCAVDIFLDQKTLLQPLQWQKPRCVFVGSMTDVFGEWAEDDWLMRAFAVMALAPRHRFLVLTKRPERMRDFIETRRRQIGAAVLVNALRAGPYPGVSADAWRKEETQPWPLANVWLGVSAEDQATADARIPLLLQTPAAKRFISYEPALGPIRLHHLLTCRGCPGCRSLDCAAHGLSWVIAGGESGPEARPAHPEWFRSVRDQCAAAGVPFFFKQWGEWAPEYELLSPANCTASLSAIGRSPEKWWSDPVGPEGTPFPIRRVGKRAAGALLDGREHRAFPEATHAPTAP